MSKKTFTKVLIILKKLVYKTHIFLLNEYLFTMRKNIFLKPFLKRAGGKRYLLPEIRKCLPKKQITSYCEPFLWWGAVLFDLIPKNALVNDINEEIINVYKTIKDSVEELIEDLQTHKNESDYFYQIRWLDREDSFLEISRIKRASRIIYLNKTCFNGLFRVNQQGQFNAPFGRYSNPNIVNKEVLRSVSKFLNTHNIEFSCGSFEDTLGFIKKGTFVYLDPPYDPISDTASFTWYSLWGFWQEDQKKVKNFCDQIHEKGAYFLLSNSSTKFIEELYTRWKQKYNLKRVGVPRTINAKANGRDKVDEFLIANYEI